MKPSSITQWTFLSLMIVALLVGLVGGRVLLNQVRKTYIQIQVAANARQAKHIAGILEERLRRGGSPETIANELQMSFENTSPDAAGFSCLIGNKGEVLCHPNPLLIGMVVKDEPISSFSRQPDTTFGELSSRSQAGGGILEHQVYGGDTQIVFSEPVRGTSWRVNVHTNFAVVEQQVRQLRQVILWTSVPSLFILSLLGTFTVRRVTQRYEQSLEQKNGELAKAVQLTKQKVIQLHQTRNELEFKNLELVKKIEELVASYQQADRIFSALAEALPGTVLDGKYQLEDKIATGGFGAVFRAIQLNLNRPVAVKVFRPAPGNDSVEAIELFRREGISTARVNHPNAITVLDSNVSANGIAYLVMELLEGHSLRQELQQSGNLSPERCGEILSPICEVLAYTHQHGLIHRDVKPENIFLQRSPTGETVKVLDFGIAKWHAPDLPSDPIQLHLTTAGLLMGTPIYMAPERLFGNPYDERSDIYSLGVMLYEMLCGQPPFSGANRNLREIFRQATQPAPTLRTLLPQIPVEIEAIVMRAIAGNPEQRPQTALELAREFTEAVRAIQPAVTALTLSRTALKEATLEMKLPVANPPGDYTGMTTLPLISPIEQITLVDETD